MAKNTVDYNAIYNYLSNRPKNEKHRTVETASGIAYGIGVERIYGGTMTKLVRDGWLEKCPCDGMYWNMLNR